MLNKWSSIILPFGDNGSEVVKPSDIDVSVYFWGYILYLDKKKL
jgi:hypothetical protein